MCCQKISLKFPKHSSTGKLGKLSLICGDFFILQKILSVKILSVNSTTDKLSGRLLAWHAGDPGFDIQHCK
jgi:hypothetical protein